jgi:hypothetical protein
VLPQQMKTLRTTKSLSNHILLEFLTKYSLIA